MITPRSARVAAAAVTIVLVTSPPNAHASFQMTKHAVSSGAVAATGGGYVLGATVAEAGVVGHAGGGDYDLTAGFWMPAVGIATGVPDGAPGEVHYANALVFIAPNPSRLARTIAFTVAGLAGSPAASSPVQLAIFDVTGRRVRTLVDENRPAGRHTAAWDGRDETGRRVASGIYFLQLRIASWSTTGRLVVTR